MEIKPWTVSSINGITFRFKATDSSLSVEYETDNGPAQIKLPYTTIEQILEEDSSVNENKPTPCEACEHKTSKHINIDEPENMSNKIFPIHRECLLRYKQVIRNIEDNYKTEILSQTV